MSLSYPSKKLRQEPGVANSFGNSLTPESPARVALIIALVVFVAETIVMLMVNYLPNESVLVEAITDALLLILLVSPSLYFILFRPMTKNLIEQQKSELRFKTLAGATFEGVAITTEGKFLDINDQLSQILGYERDELIGMNVMNLIPLEDYGRVLGNIQAGIESNIEHKMLRKDGTFVIVEAHGQTIYQQGIPIRLTAIRDVTERKQADHTILESKQRLQAHIENSPMAVVSWDKDLNVTQWAGEAENMFGWTEAETLGKAIMDLNMIYEEDIPIVQETMAKIMAADQRYVISANRNVTKDRRVIHCIWYNTIQSNEDGSMASVMSLVLDVTECKKIEQAMQALNNQLTHEVAIRTSDLAALTAHIQKIAETEKANLARELHDELGSTLTSIKMEIGRLKWKISEPDLLQDLSGIKDLVSLAFQTTRGVINQLHPAVLDVYGFIPAVEYLVKEFRKHSGIDVELLVQNEESPIEHTFVLAAYRITQECLTNIAKHAGASKVQIEVKTSDGFLDLIIQDNGKGLPSEINNGGHGIFGMIERARYLGGSMVIGSEDGKGTTARLHLPMAVTKPKGKKRVLVVDDHAIVRDALRQILENQTDDFSVEGEAADGNAAIQMAIEGAWDIILLDINLPNKSGLQVLREIKAVKPNLPIIMLSSHEIEKYGEIVLSEGAACYIEKGKTEKLAEEMRRATQLQ